MAATVLSDISDAMTLLYAARLQRQILSTAPLLFLLPMTVGVGQSANWTVQFTGNAVNAIASAESVQRSQADATDENEQGLNLSWAQYDATSSVSDISQNAVDSDINPSSLGADNGDLLERKIMEQATRVAFGIARDLYAGNETSNPVQLAGAARWIDSSTVFASIDPASVPEWASVEESTPLSTLNLARIREFITDIYDVSGHIPEFFTCNSNVFNQIRNRFNDFEANVTREVTMERGGGMRGLDRRTVTLDAGFRAVEVDQIPVVLDRFATANTLYAWNTRFVEVQQQRRARMTRLFMGGQQAMTAAFEQLTDMGLLLLPEKQVEGMMPRHMGMTPYIKKLGTRGSTEDAMVLWQGQVVCSRRNAFGKLTLS